MEDSVKFAKESPAEFIKEYRKLVTLEFLGIEDSTSYATRKEWEEKTKCLQISVDVLAKKKTTVHTGHS